VGLNIPEGVSPLCAGVRFWSISKWQGGLGWPMHWSLPAAGREAKRQKSVLTFGSESFRPTEYEAW